MDPLKLRFEPNLTYQCEAIDAAVDLFDSMPLAGSGFSLATVSGGQLGLTEFGTGNPDPGEAFEETLLENLKVIQDRNQLELSDHLQGRHFSVEMETGTGKTYVYLRTMFELNRKHAFSKFIVVVPSVAVREGVKASIDLMREHFSSLYSTPFDAGVYDSKNLSIVRQFATTSTMQILIMNIDAFRKDLDASGDEGTASANVINRANDRMSGRRPIEYIQSCRPLVVVDEPQNMESEKAAAAIDRLHPLCTLRYSATHKKLYNPIYRLGPVEAHDLELVKSIEVASVVEDENLNAAFVEVVRTDQAKMRAQLRINVGRGSSGCQRTRWVKQGTDLHDLSEERQEYADGFIVSDISFRPGDEYVEFSNGCLVEPGSPLGGFGDEIRWAQLRATVEQHLDRERALAREGREIKVLSLIFLDRVANYRVHGANGDQAGQFATWFEEIYSDLASRPKYAALDLPAASEVHDGYFSKDSKGRLRDTRGESAADVTTYDLIMRDKERLLSRDEPLRFIFTHSALREGWDNPNVFQICTLNDSRSKDRKRQEIGRGLRLPVNQNGERVRDSNINRLTIIANEAYEDFASALQTEYEEDTGRKFGVVGRTAFSRLIRPSDHPVDPGDRFGTEGSGVVWDHLRAKGIVDDEGLVTPEFRPADDDFVLPVPPEYASARSDISQVISKHVTPIEVKNARERRTVRFHKRVTLDPEFKALWDRISRRTRFRVSLDTEMLVADAVAALREADSIKPPKITIRVAQIEHSLAGLDAEEIRTAKAVATDRPAFLPDILAELQNETDLTRRTIVRILVDSGRLGDFAVNPQEFLRVASEKINRTLRTQVLAGIEYQEIAGAQWEMRRLEPEDEEAIQRYASRLYKVQNQGKTPFDHVECDSHFEHRFAKALDRNEDIKFYIKLPSWFRVDTPVGSYNPDWAIMFENGQKLYLVREMKGTPDSDQLRAVENVKIACAQRHFATINVDYAVVTDMDDLAKQLAAVGAATS